MPQKNAELLLVEDSDDDAALTLRALRTQCLSDRILRVSDGAEALEYLFATGAHAGRSASECPRVVLLDLALPKVTGLEVLRQLKSDDRTRAIPVVVLTSSDAESDLAEAYALGANSYIVKPVAMDAFSQALEKLSSYWARLNVPPPMAD